LRRRGLFVIPEEAHPPQEISATMHYLAETPPTPGFVDAVVDPATNTIMGAVAIARPHQPPHVREQRHRITELALSEGPDALTPVDKSRLLNDAIALSELHFRVWTQPSAHPRWQAAKAAIANAADAAARRAAALTGAVTVGIH
jgi:membrane glycosyltransferase